jgi:YbbR domain-containing protein
MIKALRSFLSNLATLLLALILAIIIWITATQTEDPLKNQFLQLTVEFVGLPENGIRISPERQTVDIRVEGPDSIMRTLQLSDFSAIADMSAVPFGEETLVTVQIETIHTNLDISKPSPELVEVMLEEQITRRIPIELDLRGSVARGHAQGDPLIEPAYVTVSGPASRVGQLDFGLVTVFLNNARETNVGAHRPIFYDLQGRVASVNGLTLSTENIEVTVPVEEQAGFAEKLITVEWVGEPAPGYRLLSVSVEPPSVLVEGLPTLLNRLTRLQTEPIDITGLTAPFSQQTVLDLPEGVTLDQEQEIFVTIEIEPILTTSSVNRAPILQGLSSEYEATFQPEEVRVVLFGPLPVLDALIEDDVRVTVDLFGLQPGTFNLEPTVNVPNRGIEVRSVQPSVVTVRITRIITDTDLETGALPDLTIGALRVQQPQAPQGQGLFSGRLPTLRAACAPTISERDIL